MALWKMANYLSQVCVHACVHVCVYVCMRACVDVGVRMCGCEGGCGRVGVYMCMCMLVYHIIDHFSHF